MIIPARYTEVLDNLLHNEQAKADIEEQTLRRFVCGP